MKTKFFPYIVLTPGDLRKLHSEEKPNIHTFGLSLEQINQAEFIAYVDGNEVEVFKHKRKREVGEKPRTNALIVNR